MPVLTFSGDFVASQFSLEEKNSNKTDVEVEETPFLSTDIVRIEIDDRDVGPNGEFDPNLVRFKSFSVERDGVVYEFGVDNGSKIKESGDGSAKEQGDTYFVTNDSVSPPSSGPFRDLEEQEYLFSSETSFSDGPGDYRMSRRSNSEPGESDRNFNAQSATVCFAKGTLLLTDLGEKPVETLNVGDKIITADHGAQPIRLITRSTHKWTKSWHRNKPVEIKKGALGAGLPTQDLVLSPQHRILMPMPDAAQSYFAPARQFCDMPSIRAQFGRRAIDYFHFVLDRHEVIFAQGLPTESFFPGPVALRSLPAQHHAQVTEIMRNFDTSHPARPFLAGRQVRDILARPNNLWTKARLASEFRHHPTEKAA